MAKKVEIGIFCTGQTQVNRDEVKKWLDFIGVNEDYELPSEEAVTDPALLVALAAKRCYKSFQVDLNPNLSRIRTDWGEYLDNILAIGHGSTIEHAVYSFAIENVSRVFTAEMNRHRAGWAVSEGSMRFIRFGESVPYWEPDSIKGEDKVDTRFSRYLKTDSIEMLDELVEMALDKSSTVEDKKHLQRIVLERAFELQAYLYRIQEKIWEEELAPESKFKQKKEITSMMRRIIGMGVATGGTWTGNIRALRHVITMRCEPAAEEEILHVFSRICMMMKEREPMLFGDFYKDDEGYWRPKYRKV